MTHRHRLMALALSAVFLLAVATPAVATEVDVVEDEATETTVAPAPVFEDGEPAVIIPISAEEPEEQPWTARFIYPILVVVTGVLIIGLIIGYNHSIRHRYKVVA